MAGGTSETETVHASCVDIGGCGVLLTGPSGSGKSGLSLRLIDRGATLVADDRVILDNCAGQLRARPHPNLAGKLEVYGLGILEFGCREESVISLHVALGAEVERMPDPLPPFRHSGLEIPTVRIDATRPSAAILVELALDRWGESA